MTHEEMSELYELYALGVLETAERAEIDQHIADGCVQCGQGVKRAAATNAIVMSFAPDAEPPKRLKRRLLASVGVESKNLSWLVWAGASAALLVGLLWFSVQSSQKSEELAAARAILDIVNSPETRAVSFGAGPHGNVFVNSKSGVLLIATNLPKLEPGKTFEMWVIPKGGAPKAAGLFKTDATGKASHVLTGPIDLATTGAIAVTVEPEAGTQAPTSTPIIVAPVAGL